MLFYCSDWCDCNIYKAWRFLRNVSTTFGRLHSSIFLSDLLFVGLKCFGRTECLYSYHYLVCFGSCSYFGWVPGCKRKIFWSAIDSFDFEFYLVDFNRSVCISKGWFHDSLSFDLNIPGSIDDVVTILTLCYGDDGSLIAVIEVASIVRSVHFFPWFLLQGERLVFFTAVGFTPRGYLNCELIRSFNDY